MTEMTKREIIEDFVAVARLGKPNSEETIEAQMLFKSRIMGIKDPLLLKTFPFIPKEQRPPLQSDFLEGMGRIATHLTGAVFHTPVDYETLQKFIPDKEEGVHHALRKVALELNMIEPQKFNAGTGPA